MSTPWRIFFAFCWLSRYVECSLTDTPVCLNGAWANGSCICDESQSDPCWTCVGRVLLSDPYGQIEYGLNNYSSDGSCIWLVEPAQPSAVLRLTINDFSTVCGAEFLYAYDGTSAYAVQTLALTGDSVSNNANGTAPSEPLQLTFYSGTALLYFVSNTSLPPAVASLSHFTINYRADNCSLNCSGNGWCSDDGTTCVCSTGWTGPDCSELACPANCSGVGKCVNGTCDCSNSGFQGLDCGIPVGAGVWSRATASGSYPAGGRASAAVVTLGGQIWLHGGYSLCSSFSPLLQSPAYRDCVGAGHNGTDGALYRFDPGSSRWTKVHPSGSPSSAPSARHGHVMVARSSSELLIYGGTSGQRPVGDLWSYDVLQSAWRQITVNGSVPLTGHTAHMLNSSCMLLLFGYSPGFGYSSNVYSVTLAGNGTAQMVLQLYSNDSAVVRGSYGHTSVYDPQTRLIFVYGGYKPGGGSSTSPMSGQQVTNELLAYDVAASRWSILRPGLSPVLLHSAVLSDRTMVVFGGSCGRSFAQDGGRCFMTSLMTYSLDCNTWTSADRPSLAGAGRFGHAAAIVNGSMYAVGGFNGRTLSDVLVYAPACSSTVSNTSSCAHSLSTSSADQNSASRCRATFPTGAERSALCSSFGSCFQCLGAQLNCSWNSSGGGTCTAPCQGAGCKGSMDRAQCDCSSGGATRDCRTCLQAVGCRYTPILGCMNPLKYPRLPMLSTCLPTCSQATTCESCTILPGCSWCSSYGGNSAAAVGVCYDQTAFIPTFPYGQCLQVAENSQQCQAATCKGHQTCAQCLDDPRCGWYDDGSGTGVGVCTDGSLAGPLAQSQLVISTGSEPAIYDSRRWYFLQCPPCQCNGHSQCAADTSSCISCDLPTTGQQCEQCVPGYYGNPVNGGNCSVCSCLGRSDKNMCNAVTGACFCSVRGTLGSRCNTCDSTQRYVGNPDAGVECYYPLTAEYRYTFNFSKPDEKFYSRVNLRCAPPLNDSDVDVEISCSPSSGFLNLTLESDVNLHPMILMSDVSCSGQSKFTYSAAKYAIGLRYNASLVLTLHDYSVPLILVVSFSQTSQDLDLFRFFVIFFSCFVALLLLIGVGWRLKLRHNLIRQRQRLRQQQQVMAKRAFAELYVVLEPKEDAITAPGSSLRQPLLRPSGGVSVTLGGPCGHRGQQPTADTIAATAVDSPGTLAVVAAAQPMASQLTSVVSVLMRLPTGNHAFCQPGQYGLAIGSTAVSLQHGGASSTAQPRSHADKLPWSRTKRASQVTEFTCL